MISHDVKEIIRVNTTKPFSWVTYKCHDTSEHNPGVTRDLCKRLHLAIDILERLATKIQQGSYEVY